MKNNKISIATGQGVNSNKVENIDLTYDELKKLITSFEVITQPYCNEKINDKAKVLTAEEAIVPTLKLVKNRLPWFVAGHFNSNIRKTENLLSRSLIVLDVDKYNQDLNALEMVLNEDLKQYKYLAYSTTSHTFSKPRIRIIIFITDNIATTDYEQVARNFVDTFLSSLEDAIDETSYKPNQIMFMSVAPKISNLPDDLSIAEYVPWIKENLDGKLLDAKDFMYSPASKKKSIQHSKKNLPLVKNKKLKNLTSDQITSFLNLYPASKLEYHLWLEVGMALHYQYSGKDEGLNIWDEWSKADISRYKGTKDLHSKWLSFDLNSNNPLTFATIIHKIKKHSLIFWINTTEEGKPLSTIANYQLFFNHYQIKPTYNIIKKRELILCPDINVNIHSPDIEGDKFNEIYSLCILCRLGKDEKSLRKYLSTIAHQNSFNPIKLVLEAVVYDGVSRLEEFYSKMVVLPEHEGIKRIYLKKWLMQFIFMTCLNDAKRGLVARQVLVLQGKEHIGKTYFLKELLPVELQDYFYTAAAVDLTDDMQVKNLIEHAIVEFGELPATFKKSENDVFKAFITKNEDKINIKYQVNHGIYRRNTTFAASVNPKDFLNSNDENTRLLVIPVEGFVKYKKVDMLQLYAELLIEARAAKKEKEENGQNLESIYELTSDEKKLQKTLNQEFEEPKLFEELLANMIDFSNTGGKKQKLAVTEVVKVLGYDKPMQRDLKACGTALRKLGVQRDRKKKYELSFLSFDFNKDGQF